MLKIKYLYKKFNSILALDNLHMDIGEGEIYGFIGSNGAGKTTTMRIIAGISKADSGEIWFEGKKIDSIHKSLKRQIGYWPDSFGVYDDLQIDEYLEFYASAYGLYGNASKKRVQEVLDLVDLIGFEERKVDELSRGMRQKLCLARTLIHKPKLILMDEPTLGLDPMGKRSLKRALRNLYQEGYSVLISSHDLADLSDICSKYGIINRGKMIFEGEIDEIILSIESSNPILITVFQNIERALEVLRRNPLVTRISIDKNRLSILFSGSKEEEALLMRELMEAGVMLSSFCREYNDLEALFFHIAANNESEQQR